jgi:hypothetical protein
MRNQDGTVVWVEGNKGKENNRTGTELAAVMEIPIAKEQHRDSGPKPDHHGSGRRWG